MKRLENEREVGIWGRNNRERKGRRVGKKDEARTAALAQTPKGALAIVGHKVAPFELSSPTPAKKLSRGRGARGGRKGKALSQPRTI